MHVDGVFQEYAVSSPFRLTPGLDARQRIGQRGSRSSWDCLYRPSINSGTTRDILKVHEHVLDVIDLFPNTTVPIFCKTEGMTRLAYTMLCGFLDTTKVVYYESIE